MNHHAASLKKPIRFLSYETLAFLGQLISITIFIAIAWIILSKGIHDQQLLDDFHNLAPLERIDASPDTDTVLDVIFGNRSGPLGRPVSMASFVLDGHVWPLQAKRFVRSNVLFHIATGLCVLWFGLVLFQTLGLSQQKAFYFALASAAIWTFHPLLVSTYLYIVQRMTILAGLFSLLSLITYVKVRRQFYGRRVASMILAAVAVSTPLLLAILSKESSFTSIALIAITEILLVTKLQIRTNLIQKTLLIIALLLTPILLLIWYLLNAESYVFTAHVRGFSATERLLTETRIFFDYLYNAVIPQRVGTGLFQNDIEVSKGIFRPTSTLFALIALLGLFIATVTKFRSAPYLFFALSWFFFGHLLEGSILPLELKYEHRNYLPLVGLIFGLILSIEQFANKKWGIFGIVGLSLVCVLTTLGSVKLWSTPLIQAEVWRVERPMSRRAAQNSAAQWLAQRHLPKTIDILQNSLSYHPKNLSLNLQLIQIQCLNDSIESADLNRLRLYASNGNVDNALPESIKALFDVVASNDCSGIDSDSTLQIVTLIGENKALRGSARLQAETHYLIAGALANKTDFVAAALYCNKSFAVYPDGKYALSETVSWINAKETQKAIESLERARASGGSSVLSQEKFQIELKRLSKAIERLKEVQEPD